MSVLEQVQDDARTAMKARERDKAQALRLVVDALQQDGESLYRACTRGTHHHHLICRNCGTTVEISADPVEQWARQVAAEHGFTEANHVVDVFGLCAACTALAAAGGEVAEAGRVT